MKHPDVTIVNLLLLIGVALTNLLVFCFFGKMATESFEEISNSLYESIWQALDVKLQKYFIVIIGNMQIPIYYHGFGVIILNLDTFSKFRHCIRHSSFFFVCFWKFPFAIVVYQIRGHIVLHHVQNFNILNIYCSNRSYYIKSTLL